VRTVAIYRLLYGSDFIGESLASIYPHVEQILCFVGHEMFGGRRVIKYFGHDVYLPHDIDGLTDAINTWKDANDKDDKVRVLPNPHATLLKGQLQAMINGEVIPQYDPTHVLFVESDEVWHENTIETLFDVAQQTDADEIMAAACHLFWRTYKYCSTRTNPYAIMRALKGRRSIGLTGHALGSATNDVTRHTDARLKIHNFGFAASERTIFWKHMTALSFSRDVKLDSPPREEWFEDVWRPWNGVSNRRTDLCPSIGYEDAFPPAQDYAFEQLPRIMQQRIKRNPLRDWVKLAAFEDAATPQEVA
jgi:hypothetical protein